MQPGSHSDAQRRRVANRHVFFKMLRIDTHSHSYEMISVYYVAIQMCISIYDI